MNAAPDADLTTGRRRGGPAIPTVLLLAVVVLLSLVAPASAAPDPVSPEDIDKQKAEAEERADELDQVRADLAGLNARLGQLQQRKQRSVRRYEEERVHLAHAQKRFRTATGRQRKAKVKHEKARRAVGRLAANTYQTGGLTEVAMLFDRDGPNDLLELMRAVTLFAEQGESTLRTMRQAEAAADARKRTAQTAFERQERAIRQVEEAKQEAQAAVDDQKHQILQVREERARLTSQLTAAEERAAALQRQRKAYLAWKAGGGDAAFGCDSDHVDAATDYPNGQIPESALCSLPQPGELLRADAAIAFIKLNQAYNEAFGSWICVTDSYRSLDEQEILYAEKPDLAAVPGTSNHGLGLAVDLCGGIENFGTTQYDWMVANAGRFGWYHPSWADPGGSTPEPWHWEYNSS